jgi:HEAT repeat protein
MDALRSTDPKVREQAVRQLGQERDRGAVDALIRCLKDRSYRVQAAAAEALGHIGDERAVEALIQALHGETYRLIDGDGSPGKYFEILRSAAWALGKIGTAPARQALLERYEAKDDIAVAAAVVGLGQIRDEQARVKILGALGHQEHFVRLYAARVLGEDTDSRAVDVLLKALWDDSWVVQVAAIESLGNLRDTRASEPLLNLYQDVMPYLPDSPADTDWRTEISVDLQAHAARALALLNYALPILERDFNSEIWQTRAVAAVGLAYQKDLRVFETLIQTLHDDKILSLQIAAAKALAYLGDPSAVPVFQAIIADSHIPIRVIDVVKEQLAHFDPDTPQPTGWLRQQVEPMLRGLIDGTVDVVTACHRLTQLYHYGYTWIPIIFVGIDSELDIVPPPDTYHQWNPQALEQKLKEAEPIVAAYRARAQTEAQKLLADYFSTEAGSQKPLITLEFVHGLGVIVIYPSGVLYSNQVGGYATLTPEIEGVYVPLINTEVHSEKMLWDHFTGPKWKGSCADGIDTEDADVIDGVLKSAYPTDLLTVDRSRLSESCEAWVYVDIAPQPHDGYPLYGFGERKGVLTWYNSD